MTTVNPPEHSHSLGNRRRRAPAQGVWGNVIFGTSQKFILEAAIEESK